MTTRLTPLSRSRPLFMVLLALTLIASGCTSKQRAKAPESASSQTDAGAAVDEEIGASSEESAAPVTDEAVSDELAQEELGVPDDGATAAPTSPDLAMPETQSQPPAPVTEPAKSAQTTPPPSSATAESPGFKGNFSEVSVTDIKYLSKKAGGTVVIETSAPATYHTREMPEQSQVVMEIANAQLPAKLKRPYVTKDFGQEITSIMAYQDKGSSTVRVVVQFKSPIHADVKQEGSALMVSASDAAIEVDDAPTLGSEGEAAPGMVAGADVDVGGDEVAPDDQPSGTDEAPTAAPPRTRTALTPREKAVRMYGDQDPRILPQSSIDPSNTENVKFYGRPISIEARDTSVRDVINLIAEQSGANIVLAGEVDGTISLKLRQIPWDQALLIVMKARNLGYVRQGSILRVAPYEYLQREAESAQRVVEAQKAAEPLRVKIIPVGYAKVADMERQVQPFLSKDRGRVVSDQHTNSIIVTDTPDVLERIANLVKALDLPPLQVLIEGKVVEARETFGRDFGIRWGFSGQPVDISGGKTAVGDLRTNLSVPLSGLAGNFRIGQFDIFGDVSAALGLAETEDLVHIVSSPRVVAVNNEPATIVQSTNIPITTVTATGGNVIATTNFQSIEMRLEVTPQVTSENDVIMNINIKREFAGNRVQGQIPDINKREAKTKLLVRNGETAVVGGVYQSDTDHTETGVPFLRNIPVLGWLFKSKSMQNDKSELLVFLTPRILNSESSLQKESTL